jgi:hypothetical protein
MFAAFCFGRLRGAGGWMRGRAGLLLCLLVLPVAASAVPFTFDARSLGMGGVSVATADLSTAPWANPSMLTRQKLGDQFSLLVGLGAFIRDDDDLIGDIKDFQDADDARREARDAGDTQGEARAILDMALTVRRVENKVIAPEATLLFSMGMARDGVSVAFSARSDIVAGGTMTDLSCDLISPDCNPEELISEDFNILNVEGVQANEFGLAVARDFDIFGRRVSFGIKPKFVDLSAFTFRESIITIQTAGDYWDEEDEDFDIGNLATVDLGFAVDLNDSWLLGLSVRNLLTDEFDLGDQTLDFNTETTLGLAYNSRVLTVGIDYDLGENDPLLANDSFDSLKSQLLEIGVEYRPSDFIALRAGMARNMASGIPDGARDIHYAFGLGLRYGFNFDVSAIASDHSVGLLLQAGFRF